MGEPPENSPGDCFQGASNAEKERTEPSMRRRQHATIEAEGQQIPPPQPTTRTDLDIGAEKSETTAVSDFFYTNFHSQIL